MIKPQNDEEYGPFGEAAISLLDTLFLESYQKLLIVSPTFADVYRSNIAPQFSQTNFFVLCLVEEPKGSGRYRPDLSCFEASTNVDQLLEAYRYEHAILATRDLSIMTAWAQAEYAVVAFRDQSLDAHREWLEMMEAMGVVREASWT